MKAPPILYMLCVTILFSLASLTLAAALHRWLKLGRELFEQRKD